MSLYLTILTLFLAVVRYKLGIARGKKSELWEVAVNKPDVNKFPYELQFFGENVINRLNYLIHTIYNFSFLLILKWNITQTCSWLFREIQNSCLITFSTSCDKHSGQSVKLRRWTRMFVLVYFLKMKDVLLKEDLFFCKWRRFRLPLLILRGLEMVWSLGKHSRKVSLGRKTES